MDAHQKQNEVCCWNLGKPPEQKILRDDFNATELVRAMVSYMRTDVPNKEYASGNWPNIAQ